MRPMQDIVFDRETAEAFGRDIYGSTKGYVRLHVLWQDLLYAVPAISRHQSMRVVDVGGGMGQFALRLAPLVRDVTLCEPSEAMLRKARKMMHQAGVENVQFVQAKLQGLRKKVDLQFDLVLCHAVLEWLADPHSAVRVLAAMMKRNGYLSLLFYNRNAAVLKRAFAGNFSPEKAAARIRPHALDPDDVREWVRRAALRVVSTSGIRIFHDHLASPVKRGGQLRRLVDMEIAFRQREPFASIAQHVHLVCRKR